MLHQIRTVLVFVVVAVCLAQTSTTRMYYVSREVTGTLNRITVRQPASGQRALRFEYAWAKCAVACSLVFSQGGTVSGGSVGTIVAMDDRSASPVSGVVLDGTMASTTAVLPTISLIANEEKSINGGLLFLSAPGTSTRKEFTLALTSTASGLLQLYTVYSEPQ